MDGRMTEIYRNCRFRLFPVTEIGRSPFRGADGFGLLFGFDGHPPCGVKAKTQRVTT